MTHITSGTHRLCMHRLVEERCLAVAALQASIAVLTGRLTVLLDTGPILVPTSFVAQTSYLLMAASKRAMGKRGEGGLDACSSRADGTASGCKPRAAWDGQAAWHPLARFRHPRSLDLGASCCPTCCAVVCWHSERDSNYEAAWLRVVVLLCHSRQAGRACKVRHGRGHLWVWTVWITQSQRRA